MRRLSLLAAALAALILGPQAAAHPLGNFTINRFVEVQASGDELYVRYVVDFAEIPAYQQRGRVRSPGYARSLARGLLLRVDGRRAPLRLLSSRIRARAGTAGLETLRLEAVYEAARSGSRIAFTDRNFGDRLGWKEVVVRADRGARIVSSSAPPTSVSDALRAYPVERLRSPLDVRSATAVVEAGTASGVAPRLGTAPAARQESGFEALVSRDLTPGFVLVSLALALFWGAAHGLGPGHGKAIVAGYLVGTRGTPRHALLLGLTVTVTHTIGVFALGLVTLALSELIVPEDLYPWLNLVAALLVVIVGVGVVRSRVRSWLHARAHARTQDHAHHHHHHHHHHHGHEHGHGELGLRGLLGVGISGGIVPCPTALVVLLAAVSLHRVGYGLLLIVAFSVGLAATVTGIGLIAVTAKRLFVRTSFEGPLVRLLPAASAAVVLALGLVMTARALPPLI
jgi:nickel/cobalt exporter